MENKGHDIHKVNEPYAISNIRLAMTGVAKKEIANLVYDNRVEVARDKSKKIRKTDLYEEH